MPFLTIQLAPSNTGYTSAEEARPRKKASSFSCASASDVRLPRERERKRRHKHKHVGKPVRSKPNVFKEVGLLGSDDEGSPRSRLSRDETLDVMIKRVVEEQSSLGKRQSRPPARMNYTKDAQRAKTFDTAQRTYVPEEGPSDVDCSSSSEGEGEHDASSEDGVEKEEGVEEEEQPRPLPVANASWRRPQSQSLPLKKRALDTAEAARSRACAHPCVRMGS